jgi:adhesin transport system outer membrane protein
MSHQNKWICSVLIYLAGTSVSFAQAGSLNLKDLLREGIKSYPSIQSKKSSLDSAETEHLASKLKFLPGISVTTAKNSVSQDQQVAAGYGSQNANYTTFTASLPIFSGGSNVAGYNKTNALVSSGDFALKEARADVAMKIINAYAEWYRSYLKIQALKESVAEHRKLVGLITRRYDAGIASGSERDLAESRLAQAEVDIAMQQSIQLTSLSTLSQLVGQPISNPLLQNKISSFISVAEKESVFTAIVDKDPTLNRVRNDAKAAEADAGVTRAQSMPQLALQGQRQNGNPYVQGAPGMSMVGLVLSYSPGAGFASVASGYAAYDRAKSSQIAVETTERELRDKVSAEFNDYVFSLLRQQAMSKAVKLTVDLGASYDRQYLAGKKTWLDLMNGIREIVQTKSNLADIEATLLSSSWRLNIRISGTEFLDE